VPLTGFCCNKKGFRITLLETDDEKRKGTWNAIAESIKTYLASA
jgi:alanine-synthesizing transaminase